jgi:hypothetical protein
LKIEKWKMVIDKKPNERGREYFFKKCKRLQVSAIDCKICREEVGEHEQSFCGFWTVEGGGDGRI